MNQRVGLAVKGLKGDYAEFVSKQAQLKIGGSERAIRLRNVVFKTLLRANTPDILSYEFIFSRINAFNSLKVQIILFK